MKFLATVLALGTFLATTGFASAQYAGYDYINRNRAAVRAYYGNSENGVAANGRCGGVSYGTGARSCGTATGGPVGGLSSRN